MTSINEDIIKGKWKEIKGEIQKSWGNITGDELEKTKGDLNSLAGLVQQRHGEGKEQFKTKLSEIVQKLQIKRDSLINEVKEVLKG